MPQLIPQRDFSEVGMNVYLTENQQAAVKAIRENTVTFITGPAGTGKSHIGCAEAVRSLLHTLKNKKGRTHFIHFIRAAVEAQENLGFLPGELDEKVGPYMEVFHSLVAGILGENGAKLLNGLVQTHPVAFLRGLTFENCFVIVDEAQNLTPSQMELILTRLGRGGKMVICGDTRQTDIQGQNGLKDAQNRLKAIPGLTFVKLTMDDMMRNGIVRRILEAYEGISPEAAAESFNKTFDETFGSHEDIKEVELDEIADIFDNDNEKELDNEDDDTDDVEWDNN